MLRNILNGNFSVLQTLMYVVSSLVIVFLVLPMHEWAHGFAATKLGDPTPKYQGRLTLNPFAHIDYLGALMIILFGFGWAKPVQVNARNFKNPKAGMALTALAGPFSNLLAAAVAMLILNAVNTFAFGHMNYTFYLIIAYFLIFLIQINISLAVFNLIPIPPLDGSRILGVVLPSRIYFQIMKYEQYIMIGIWILLLSGFLDRPMTFLIGAVYDGLAFITGLPFKMFA